MNTLRRLAAMTMIAMTLAGSAFAADLAIPPIATPRPLATPKDIPVQQNQPHCSRWTDDCVTCSRGTRNDGPTCSNIGFACQPKAIRCLSGDTSQGQLPK